MPWVVKRDGRREPWSRDKVLHGLQLACRKRPIDRAGIESAAARVERRLMAQSEVSTARVGETVMAVLRDLDAVAYVRFASVYGAFESVEQFSAVISSIGVDHDTPSGVELVADPASALDGPTDEW